MAARLILVSILLSAWLVLAQAQGTPANEATSAGDVPAAAGSIDPTEARRQRLRSFFSRRREQRVKPGAGEEVEESVAPRSRRVRPKVNGIRKQKPQEEETSEERVITSVSVSSSVSTSSRVQKRPQTRIPPTTRKPEISATAAANRTTRKRFRLIKNSKVNQDALLEKLLANIDLKNEIESEQKPSRPSRFRPSINRAQIRKKAESALRPKDKNSRISLRIRKPDPTTKKTKTVQAQEQEVEAATEPNLRLATQPEDESIANQVTTVVTERYPGVTRVAEEVAQEVFDQAEAEANKIIKEVTTERQSTPVITTSNSFEATTKIDRQSFFRRTSPRRFGFGRRPQVPSIAPADVIIRKPTLTAVVDDRAIVSNSLPKEAEIKFGSFPARTRLSASIPTNEEVQQFRSRPESVEIRSRPEPVEIRSRPEPVEIRSRPEPVEIRSRPEPVEIRSRPEPVEIQTKPPTLLPQQRSNDLQVFNLQVSDSQPKIQVNTRRNQINRFQNSFPSPNSIVQPAFLKPTQFKQPQPINVPETQRSIPEPRSLPIRGQSNRIQPSRATQAVKVQPAPVRSETLFPKFQLPDFFNVPFASFQTQATTNPKQQATVAQNSAGALFSGIGVPQGRVQGHPRAHNFNIITGSYSVGW